MTINDFLQQIYPEILERGQKYYEMGYIRYIDQINKTNWHGEVEGNYGNYNIMFKMDNNNNITNYNCDCPYDDGICKHLAAVALKMEEEKLIEHQTEVTIQNSWQHIIENASLDELRDFMIEYGNRNGEFRHQVQVMLAKSDLTEGETSIEYHQRIVEGIFEKYSYDGYINYRDMFNLDCDISDIQQKTDGYCKKEKYDEAFSISAAIAMECIKAVPVVDDSSGECGGLISTAIIDIQNIFNQTKSPKTKNSIFEWTKKQLDNSDYYNYGSSDELESLFFSTAHKLGDKNAVYEYLNKEIKKQKKEKYGAYRLESILLMKINFLQSDGRNVEADATIDSHLNIAGIRQIRIDQAIASKNIKQHEKLLLDGINIAQKENNWGTTRNWKEQLIAFYQQQKQTSKVNILALDLFQDRPSEIEYFLLYKKTTPENKWIPLRDKLISTLASSHIDIHSLAKLYIEEKMIDKLLDLIKKYGDIDILKNYHCQLKDHYSEELIDLYKIGITKQAKQLGRDNYIYMARLLEKMATIDGGLTKAKELQNLLLQTYSNRPAMKQEFAKINW